MNKRVTRKKTIRHNHPLLPSFLLAFVGSLLKSQLLVCLLTFSLLKPSTTLTHSEMSLFVLIQMIEQIDRAECGVKSELLHMEANTEEKHAKTNSMHEGFQGNLHSLAWFLSRFVLLLLTCLNDSRSRSSWICLAKAETKSDST